MGVHGLWKLLEAAGKPVPLETLDNKVLAVDVSIWLHQMMKGYQDSRGAPVPNAHLLGLFHRVCKLLFYRIKPVFVFDGGVPLLKKQTIVARKKQKTQASQSAAEAKEKLLKNLIKRKAVRQLLKEPTASNNVEGDVLYKDDMFNLPPLPQEGLSSDSEDESQDRLQVFMENSGSDIDSEPDTKPSSQQLHGLKIDLHTIDVNSEEFCSLPPDVRHDILSDLKETRKQNSWGRLHEMPEESKDFSNYQLGRLLKRRSVQVSLEKAEKEMGGKVLRMNELQELMEAQGVNIMDDDDLIHGASKRIASDSATRYVLCKETPSTSQPSGTSQSSSFVETEEENPLYNEQVEYIAQMAENMLQNLTQKKNGTIPKEEKENLKQVKETNCDEIFDGGKCEPVPNVGSPLKQKILADSWSSDEGELVESETSLNSSQASQTSNYTRSAVTRAERTDLKRRIDSIESEMQSSQSQNSASKIHKFNSGEYNESKISRDSCTISQPSQSNFSANISNDSFIACNKASINILNSKGSQLQDDIGAGTSKRKLFEVSGENYQDAKTVSVKEAKIEVNIVSHPENNGDIHFVATLESETKKVQEKLIDYKDHIEDNKPLEIVICPGEEPDDNDIFADIFECPIQERSLKHMTAQAVSVNVPNVSVEEISKDVAIQVITDENTMSSDSSSDFDEGEASKDVVMENATSTTRPSDSMPQSNFTSAEVDSNQSLPSSVLSTLLGKATTTTSDLNEVEATLEVEQLNLQKEKGRQERLAASITDQMCIEAQELLQLFGLPYIVAPMEAEAQCAFLDVISLTEGSITDDSDIWLFGGKKVYKNFFNQKKHVLQFSSSNISHYFKLSREQLIQLALLVGSDYTTGIQGVGPVTALEIVAAFHGNSEPDPIQNTLKGLSHFKEWWNSGKPHKSNRLRLLDRKLKNIKFSEGFPNKAVVEAYLHPSVEDSHETFSWGTLDLPALREYARSKFGWPASKTDEILLPVSKRWTARNSQRTIESYFDFRPHLVEGLSKMSKRVQKAVTLMDEDVDSDCVDDPSPIATQTENKQHKKKSGCRSVKKTANTRRKNTSESDTEQNEHLSTAEKDSVQLPVRAPIVPRERSSTGVKRIARKVTKNAKVKENSDTHNNKVQKGKGGKVVSAIRRTSECSSSDNESDSERIDKPNSDHSDINDKKIRKLDEAPSTRALTVPRQRSSTGVKRVGVKSTKNFIQGTDIAISLQKPPRKSTGKVSSSEHSAEEVDRELAKTQKDKGEFRETESSIMKNSLDQSMASIPSCSQSENVVLSDELVALSGMDWEDDPWDVPQDAATTSNVRERRTKVFFGGVRQNKPKRPTRPVVPNPVDAQDTRGVRPGWLTRERLESRTAWVDMAHSKREESIPQRQQDQKALEEAKMKAIAVIKASDTRQASRLLGRSISKRGKGKVRPTGKILPEHNLSESSSDE